VTWPESRASVAQMAARIRPLRSALDAISDIAPNARPRAQKLVWRGLYTLWSRSGVSPAFMNYGYAPLSGTDIPDDMNFGTALYDHVTSGADLVAKEVLEVGCGRGGGASFIARTRHPRSMVGLDISSASIALARADFERPGLRFLEGDAEALPFEDRSFDTVVNIESAHCYPNVPRFLKEVHRVLRPGGLFLLADVRFTKSTPNNSGSGPLRFEDAGLFRKHVESSPFQILEEEDITANVSRALLLENERRSVSARDQVFLKRFQRYAVRSANRHRERALSDFLVGNYAYLRYRLQKDDHSTSRAAAQAP
jgi:SAM-dependent methyltransferase